MNNESDKPESSSGKFLKTVQPLRDLESNWTVDLAKNLEEYLLKICSGQISGYEDAIFNVNFAEAALLLQGSVQVYSRKVEYLYSLVLHALDFISQKSQDEQPEGESSQKGATHAHTAKNDEDDQFWVSDDIPIESKILLDSSTCKEPPSHFVRPPANLVVLEGECLDAGDAGELESYLLGTSDLYRDFILLDSCDAVAVDSFLDSKAGRGPTNIYRGSSVISKGRKSFFSPTRQSGGAGLKLSVRKTHDANLPRSPLVDNGFESNDGNVGCSTACDFTDGNDDFGMGDRYSEPDSDGEDNNDDPWKPLNPHETGNLKIKPYKKVKANMKLQVGGSKKQVSLTSEFPLAKLCGPISTELTEIWEAKFGAAERLGKSESLYEKLRQSLLVEESKINEAFDSPEDNDDDNGYDSGSPDTGPIPDFDMPDKTFNSEDIPLPQEKHDVPEAPADLEDLCRSHLDALLATLAENEKQTEMATRVSTWKQRIEQNLDEQDARPPFDIHKYGERVLNKLSTGGDSENNALSFGDVVKGQEKHDVARTFSALLQLVNNGDVDLVRDSHNVTPTCHSNANPFFVKLLKNERKKGILLQSSRKRAKSPIVKAHGKVKNGKGKENCPAVDSSPHGSNSSCRFSANLGKPSSRSRCTPEGKKRRKSRLVVPLDMQFVG
ncbi:condensin-2 complex subunit h2 [Phtheirospermum japonicum]|uniref:Condensin-2 complex subunit H2 n=1 Tax=Phtheirospermum japonicum TaxID=374723 RepID=A0A830DHT3_9LAMI|nr:condensin-2 complex subunit h2 [Phtheirospermum japonicum]